MERSGKVKKPVVETKDLAQISLTSMLPFESQAPRDVTPLADEGKEKTVVPPILFLTVTGSRRRDLRSSDKRRRWLE